MQYLRTCIGLLGPHFWGHCSLGLLYACPWPIDIATTQFSYTSALICKKVLGLYNNHKKIREPNPSVQSPHEYVYIYCNSGYAKNHLDMNCQYLLSGELVTFAALGSYGSVSVLPGHLWLTLLAIIQPFRLLNQRTICFHTFSLAAMVVIVCCSKIIVKALSLICGIP